VKSPGRARGRLGPLVLTSVLFLPAAAYSQSFSGSLGGTVTDPQGARIPGAELVLKNEDAGVELRRTTADDGTYAFPNLAPGTYTLAVIGPGFRPHRQTGIELRLGSDVRLDVRLSLGPQTESVEVVGSSALTWDNGSREDGIAPDTLEALPLLVSGSVRSSAAFAILMPGVTTGGTGSPFDARVNGGLHSGDEAVLDGASMQQGFMSQSGMVSLFADFPYSPDMVSEIKVVGSSYAPEYGSSTSGQIVAVTKSGTDSFHGAAFEYFRHDSLNARPWGLEGKPENEQHNYGANVGGPLRLPGLWSDAVKTYFYVDVEGFRQEGALNRLTVSIPSLKQRNGDFTDWVDASGNLIPIYDPATTRVLPDGTVVRDRFMGCDGRSPNVVCPDRFSPLAQEWLQFLPEPTREGPLNNFTAPPIPFGLGRQYHFFGRFDTYIGRKDHVAVSLWHQRIPKDLHTVLPRELAWEAFLDPLDSWVNRLNWDHTFRPDLLNHLSFGYLNRNEGYGCINQEFVDVLPKIPGVVSHDAPPKIAFGDGFLPWGCDAGRSELNISTRPTYVLNDLLTWVKGSHTLKAGFEYRNIGGNVHQATNESGTFYFDRGSTGLLGVNSGSPIASFLLGTVAHASMVARATNDTYPRQQAWIVHVGDTWRATDKLTLIYGLRWDYFSPSREKYNRLSFFDPVGANPGAGGRPGRLAFAGTGWGEASYGVDYPETRFYGAFAPRLGLTYALGEKTLLRAGAGIFYDRAFYPGWAGGMSQQGFVNNVAFGSSLGGLEGAFLLHEGMPGGWQPPPFVDSAYSNGQDILYRTLDANERPRTLQWNVTLDREITRGLTLGVAYVGSRATRVPSNNRPQNALDPSLLSMGPLLYDEFQPGQTELHGVPLPYEGWVEQMQSCPPSLAQALLPYPQYCSSLQGLNENHGKSSYDSFQAKLEKRLGGGTFFLVSYTLGRILTSGSDDIQREAVTWRGAGGVISPYEQGRNRALAIDDVTHVLSAALLWDVPFAKSTTGLTRTLLDGWQVSTIFRYSSGIPFFFRSGVCNVPSQFRAGCIPSIHRDPFAQDVGDFDPARGPLFDPAAFDAPESFDFDWGSGDRVTAHRGQSYRNQDLSLIKNTRIGKGMNLQLRISAFNLWNWHAFTASGARGTSAFNTDIASPDFGQWNGTVTDPRNIQVSARLEF
jgi:hypothetical protein